MGTDPQRPALTEGEAKLLAKQVRRRKLSLAFCVLNLACALALTLVYFFTEKFTALRAVVILLILIGAKNHMRIYRLSGLLEKLDPVSRPEDRGSSTPSGNALASDPQASEAGKEPSDLHEQVAD